jgi:glycine cleavage system H protein
MNGTKPAKRELYYTHDYEWIDFQGSVAYIGVCNFKLSGIKEIQKIEFSGYVEPFKQGDIIATIQYDDYRIPVHMPVDGKIVSINDVLSKGDKDTLLKKPETDGWIALIVPGKPLERKGLLQMEKHKY